MIRYQNDKEIPLEALARLYEDAAWTAYTRDLPALQRAVRASWRVFTAWEGEELLGLLRAVGDGETICYLQDLLVRSDRQCEGIATSLLEKLFADLQSIRQVVLMTDAGDAEVLAWYARRGFMPFEAQGLQGLILTRKSQD